MNQKHIGLVTACLRISLGLIFVWAFVDKLFGFGFATKAENSWLSGGSPTSGFLKFGTHGPLASFFQSLAGQTWVDWMFMLGLIGIGLALVLGIGMKIATWSATALLFFMWLALLPPANHPFIDDHIIYIIALHLVYALNAEQKLGLGAWWSTTPLVQKAKWLQ